MVIGLLIPMSFATCWHIVSRLIMQSLKVIPCVRIMTFIVVGGNPVNGGLCTGVHAEIHLFLHVIEVEIFVAFRIIST